MSRMNKEIINFLARGEGRLNHNEWIVLPEMEVYLRSTQRHIPDIGRVSTFEIANVTVRPDLRGTGIFTRFLKEVEATVPHDYIFVEAVLIPRFIAYFRIRGWIELPSDGFPSFYKKRESVYA